MQYVVGERLGILQVKIAVIGILRNYKLDVCEKTITSFKHYNDKIVNIPNVNLILKMTRIN